jgi:hypothetical protein
MVRLEYIPCVAACGITYIVKLSSEIFFTQAEIFELIEKASFPKRWQTYFTELEKLRIA